jgi:hypothetical protein
MGPNPACLAGLTLLWVRNSRQTQREAPRINRRPVDPTNRTRRIARRRRGGSCGNTATCPGRTYRRVARAISSTHQREISGISLHLAGHTTWRGPNAHTQ